MKRLSLLLTPLALTTTLMGGGLAAAPGAEQAPKSGLAIGEQAQMFTFASIHTGKSGCVT